MTYLQSLNLENGGLNHVYEDVIFLFCISLSSSVLSNFVSMKWFPLLASFRIEFPFKVLSFQAIFFYYKESSFLTICDNDCVYYALLLRILTKIDYSLLQ